MSMAKLSIWVSGMEDPCGVSDRIWFITIYGCDGNVLEWCGRRYVVLPAPCGHLEVEVPPGCYYVKAVWSYRIIRPGTMYAVNHFTDAAIVQARCDETVCVKLFNPSAHRCGIIIARAITDLMQQKLVKPETAQKATQAIQALVAELPKPARLFELGHLDEIDKLVEARAKEEKQV
jgi:hypothetical protein